MQLDHGCTTCFISRRNAAAAQQPHFGRRRIGGALALPLLACMAVVLPACQAPPAATEPTAINIRLAEPELFYQTSLTLLRRYDLAPDRVDRSRGLIVSERTTSAQWFEPWRVDAPGGYQTLESSLHTIARRVFLTLEPVFDDEIPAAAAPAPATAPADVIAELEPISPKPPSPASDRLYTLGVRVEKYRYSAPERQITTASGALAIYDERIPTTEGLRRAESRGAHWVELGRDPLLESFLMTELLDRLPGTQFLDATLPPSAAP